MQTTETRFKELTAKDHDAFAAAADNLKSIHEHDLDILREKNVAKVNAVINRLPFQTWQRFLDRARLKRRQLLGLGAQDPDFPGESEPDLKQARDQTNKNIENLSKELTSAQAEAEKTLPIVGDIEKAIQNIIASGKIGQADLETIKSEAQKVPNVFSSLKSLANSVTQPEGLTPLILDARLRRLKIEQERIDLRLEYKRSEIQALTDLRDRIAIVVGDPAETGWCDPAPAEASNLGLFRYFLSACPKPALATCREGSNVNGYGACPKEKIITTIASLAKASHGFDEDALGAREGLTDLLSILGFYTSTIGTQQFLLESADIEQQYSATLFQLRMLELDSEEHVIMLGAGIDGLAIYEKGGIRSEDMGHLIQAAQAAAVAAIAGRSK